ncbi:MAG: DUF935 family protein, partial [Nitrososphaerales archaeon]
MNWRGYLSVAAGRLLERLADPGKGTNIQPDAEFGIPEEVLFRQSDTFKHSPDILLQRRGFKILQRMAQDDQIGQAIEAKKTMRLSTGVEWEPANDSPEAETHARFMEFNTTDCLKGSFNKALRDIMGALNLGHSITEINITEIKSGEFTGKLGLQSLKSKNPIDWNIDVDDFDNIKEDGIVKVTAPDIGTRLPYDKFIVYSFRPQYEDVFGTSNYRILYDLWWLKHIFKRAWGVFGERYGVPVGVAKYPKSFKKPAQESLFALMKAIKTETNVVVPEGVEIAFAEARSRGEFFNVSIRLINEQITKVILGQTLTSSQGDKGSQSLGSVHFDILAMELDELGVDLGENINEQLTKPMIDINFAGVTEYPKMVFPSMVPEDEMPLVEKFLSAMDKGIVKATEDDEKHIRKVLQFPVRDRESILLNDPDSATLPTGPLPPNPGPGSPPGGGAPVSPANTDGDPQAPAGDDQPGPEGDPEKLAESIFTGVGRRTPTKFEEKMDFEAVLRTIEETGVEDITEGLDPILRESLDRLIREVQRKQIIANKDLKAVRDLEFRNKSDIKKVIESGLLTVGRRGVKLGKQEIRASKKVERLADLGEFNAKEVEGLLKANSFKMTGNITGAMETVVQQSLFNSIVNGASEQEAIDGLVAALQPFFMAGAAATEDFTSARLATIVRTNVVGSMNVARREFFLQDTELTPAFQYSAVLDDRVRPNHAAMDERTFRVSNPIWGV